MTGLTAAVGSSTRHRVVIALCIVPITLMVVFAIRRGLIDLDTIGTGTVPGLADRHRVRAAPVAGVWPHPPGDGLPRRCAGAARRPGSHEALRPSPAAGANAPRGGAGERRLGRRLRHRLPVGGRAEASASLVCGLWFLTCLVRAFLAIRGGDPATHRRFMIRAFVVAIGVGTIRVWLLLLWGSGLLDIRTAFGVSFWLAFVIHAAVAEWWVRTSPPPVDAVPAP
jgi:hypothetical protein